MDAQLRLLPSTTSDRNPRGRAPWRIDPATRAAGHEGIALARAALRRARPAAPLGDVAPTDDIADPGDRHAA